MSETQATQGEVFATKHELIRLAQACRLAGHLLAPLAFVEAAFRSPYGETTQTYIKFEKTSGINDLIEIASTEMTKRVFAYVPINRLLPQAHIHNYRNNIQTVDRSQWGGTQGNLCELSEQDKARAQEVVEHLFSLGDSNFIALDDADISLVIDELYPEKRDEDFYKVHDIASQKTTT